MVVIVKLSYGHDSWELKDLKYTYMIFFLCFFRLGSVMCMGAMAGAYVLTLFAVWYLIKFSVNINHELICSSCLTNYLFIYFFLQIKYSERVNGLILISPICREPSWNEWFYNKVGYLVHFFHILRNFLGLYVLNKSLVCSSCQNCSITMVYPTC